MSRDRRSVVAFTGTSGEGEEWIRQLLLDSGSFLGDRKLLKNLLFPCRRNEILTKRDKGLLRRYVRDFSLRRSLRDGFIPEVARISDLRVVGRRDRDHPPLAGAYYSRNSHPGLSEGIFVSCSRDLGFEDPGLFEVCLTGEVFSGDYIVMGCGASYALAELRKQLRIKRVMVDTSLSPVYAPIQDEEIDVDRAVGIVRDCVDAANRKSHFCGGFEYVVATPYGIETHFSDEERETHISVDELIEWRISALLNETYKLEEIADRLKVLD